jgi:hypothetical protein
LRSNENQACLIVIIEYLHRAQLRAAYVNPTGPMLHIRALVSPVLAIAVLS